MAKLLLPRAHYHSLVDSFLMSASHSCNVFLEFYVHDGIISTRFSDTNKPVAAELRTANNSSNLDNKTDPQADSVGSLNTISPFKKRRLADADLQKNNIQEEGEKPPEEPAQPTEQPNSIEPTQNKTNASGPSEGSTEDTEKRNDSASPKQSELSAKNKESTIASSSTCSLVSWTKSGKGPLNHATKRMACKKDYICLQCFKNTRNFMCSTCCANICYGGFSCPEINDHAKEKCPICSTVIVINSFLNNSCLPTAII